MSIKKYKVSHTWNEGCEISLEVDLDILTRERAKEINEFWSNHEERVDAEKNCFIGAVIRLFGVHAMNLMLSQGGCSFGENNEAGPVWSKEARAEEGWGEEDKDSIYGWCGIRIIGADVETVSYDEVELKEI